MKTKLLALIGLLAIVVAIVAAGYFFGGFYSVAATQPEPEIVAPRRWSASFAVLEDL